MAFLRSMSLFLVAAVPFLTMAGCPIDGLSFLLPNEIRVEIVNDTNFSIDPHIEFDEDDGLLGGLFTGEELDTGLIAAGETQIFRFDCDSLGTIRSDEAEQFFGILGSAAADSSPTLQRDDDYDCGDTIRFRFVGDGSDFGVIVSVNGRIVG